MPQKRKPDQKKQICDAALALADAKGWGHFTLEDVLRKAKVNKAENVNDVWDVLYIILKNIDQLVHNQMKDSLSDRGLSDSWRDNLFEILMTRFDIVQPHRSGFSSLLKAAAKHPDILPRFLPLMMETLSGMLSLAGLPKRACSHLQTLVFSGFYLAIIREWLKDETKDMSKTMSAIDKRLGQFERVMSIGEK